MYNIIIDMKKDEREAYREAGLQLISITRKFRKSFPRGFEIEVETNNQSEFNLSILNDTRLIDDFCKHWDGYGHELLIVSKLIELGLGELATDIAWEVIKVVEKVEDPKNLFMDARYTFGLDILYVVARSYPDWARLYTSFYQESWNEGGAYHYFFILEDLVTKLGWSNAMLAAYTEARHKKTRQVLSAFGGSLRIFLQNQDNLRTFMGYIMYKFNISKPYYGKDSEELTLKIKELFNDASINYSIEDVSSAFLGINLDPNKNKLVAKLLDVKSDTKDIQFDIKFECAQDTNIAVEITHPHMVLHDYNFQAKGLSERDLKSSTTRTNWDLDIIDGQTETIIFPFSAKGDYLLKIKYKNEVILEKSVFISKGREQKVEVLEHGSFDDGNFLPFDKSDKRFGIKFKIYNGKAVGEIYHPKQKFIGINEQIYERDMTKIFYNNSGIYTFLFDPQKCLDFVKGEFYFVIWDEGKNNNLHEQKFDFRETSKSISPIKKVLNIFKKKEEDYQKAWIKSYGVFGFASNYQAGVNINLTPPTLNRKAGVGSYIGCMYTLNEKLFKNTSTLNIFVKVEVKDFDGNIIHRDKWPDVAYKDRDNTCAFVVEQGELFEGHWVFTVTHNGKELFEQSIPVMTM